MTKALNHVSDVDEFNDTFTRRLRVELVLLAGLLTLGLLALAFRPAIDRVWDQVPIATEPERLLVGILGAGIRAGLLFLIFALVYAVVPRGARMWRAVPIGAPVATGLFLMAQGVFAVVKDSVWDNLSLVYGPLAIAALLLSWAWYVALITLAGGALASHVKVMVLEDDTAQRAGERHAGR